jgi:hypothetical protein
MPVRSVSKPIFIVAGAAWVESPAPPWLDALPHAAAAMMVSSAPAPAAICLRLFLFNLPSGIGE